MRYRILAVAALGAALLAAPALAQKPDLDAVPDKMPFDIPFGAPISLAQADTAINAAIAETARRGWKMNVAVVDWSGNLVAFKRMDNAQIASVDIAIHKARAAAKFRRETKVFEGAIQNAGLIYILSLDDAIASRGGIPLVVDGKLIGAIGCSGATGSQDEVACKAGAAVVK